MSTSETTAPEPITIKEQAPVLLSHLAGFVAQRTVVLGLRTGMIKTLAEAGEGATSDQLAGRLGFDPWYVSVWCQSAVGAGLVDRDGDRYRLAPHVATLLLDTSSPAYLGGVYAVLDSPEVFDWFERSLASGERLWWDQTSPDWIAAVSGAGTPFYTRLIPGGLTQVPGLAEALAAGCRVADTACGAGLGIVKLAAAYPGCEFVGVDGDAHSIDVASKRITDAGLADRVTLVTSPLEDMDLSADPVAVVINNISMHECRDIDKVTENVKAALEPGGWLVISDFPFPDTDDGLRTVPGRVMSGIQFFEAQIDDQLLPRVYYSELLAKHGFVDIGTVSLTPMHALTFGRRPS
ncbi:MAG: methyltransferase domain-containing protein [Sporichthyaceae bacterium]|nr:methyltransferase domain-containing protein [Sporichthyaceae bacterium]